MIHGRVWIATGRPPSTPTSRQTHHQVICGARNCPRCTIQSEILLGNYKNDPAYNPFPKKGLIRDYELLIRDKVAKFCKRYPHVNRQECRAPAVRGWKTVYSGASRVSV